MYKRMFLAVLIVALSGIAYASPARVFILDPDTEQGADVENKALDINLREPSTHDSGQKTVTSAGTAEALAVSTACLSVTVKALHANTNMIYVGASDVDSSNGFVLDAGEAVTVDIDNVNDVYIDADTNGEGVSFIYVSE